MELTDKQIKRQDFVDNKIFLLISELNTSTKEVDWDIEMIGNVRNCIQNWLVEKSKIDDMTFYPFMEE